MSEMSRSARSAMRSKIARLVKTDPKAKVDASDYSPPDALDAGVKTGARPLSRRQFKKGGKVVGMHGEMSKQHAGRKPRKSGGKAITANSYINRDVREANEEREGKKHIGAFKKGGMVKHDDVAEDKKLIKKVVKPSALKGHEAECRCAKCGGGAARKSGGRTKKAAGGMGSGVEDPGSKGDPFAEAAERGLHYSDEKGDYIQSPRSRAIDEAMEARKDAEMQKNLAKGYAAATGRKHGGKAGKGSSVSEGKFQGTRPTGGRMARKHGGKAMKGATIIKIDIAPKQDGAQGGLGAGAGLPPMPPRPIPMPPVGAGAPMPMPPAPPAGAPPMPPGGAMPPMGRKAGGRVGHRSYKKVQDMDAGSGGGLGRLEKVQIYGKKA